MLGARKVSGDFYDDVFEFEQEIDRFEKSRRSKRSKNGSPSTTRRPKRTANSDRMAVSVPKVGVQRKERKLSAVKISRAVDYAFTFVVIAAMLFLGALLVRRYEKMSAENTKVLQLKNEIANVENSIESHKIQIEFAMDIATAQMLAASDLLMDYPSLENIIQSDEIAPAKTNPETQ